MHTLLAQGTSIKEIARRLRLARGTVQRYARAPTAESLIGTNPPRGDGPLEAFKTELHHRYDDGDIDTRTMFTDIRARGYRGTLRTLQRFITELRGHERVPAPRPAPPARQITGWIMRPDTRLSEDDRTGLKQARTQCPDLDTLTHLAHGFARLVRNRGGARLETWINEATDSPFPEIRGFAAGLLRDYDAVVAGLTHHWNSGAVEGTVNRIKMMSSSRGHLSPRLSQNRT